MTSDLEIVAAVSLSSSPPVTAETTATISVPVVGAGPIAGGGVIRNEENAAFLAGGGRFDSRETLRGMWPTIGDGGRKC